MQKSFPVAALILGALIALAACKANDGAEGNRNVTARATPSTPPPASSPPAKAKDSDVRRITIVEARAADEAGQALFVDVRDEEGFKRGHIKGARLLPSDQVAKRARELPSDKLIIFYCA